MFETLQAFIAKYGDVQGQIHQRVGTIAPPIVWFDDEDVDPRAHFLLDAMEDGAVESVVCLHQRTAYGLPVDVVLSVNVSERDDTFVIRLSGPDADDYMNRFHQVMFDRERTSQLAHELKMRM